MHIADFDYICQRVNLASQKADKVIYLLRKVLHIDSVVTEAAMEALHELVYWDLLPLLRSIAGSSRTAQMYYHTLIESM